LFQCFSESHAQEQEKSPSVSYFGGFLSFSPMLVEYSKYLFAFGGQAIYPMDNQYISLEYHRSNGAYSRPSDYYPDDDSNIDRIEFCYGRIGHISDRHELLRGGRIGVFIGLSYYTIKYYADETAYIQRHASYAHGIGIPIGFTATNSFGKRLFYGQALKFTIGNTIGARENIFVDFEIFLLVNLF
jgi:hypothetical protein